jgi:hypothetical protein
MRGSKIACGLPWGWSGGVKGQRCARGIDTLFAVMVVPAAESINGITDGRMQQQDRSNDGFA